MNSSVIFFLFQMLLPKLRGGFYEPGYVYLKEFPIPTGTAEKRTWKARHDRMVELVQRMLDLHKRLPDAKTHHERTLLQRQIDTTDKQIDQLVYELYGLTEEEIRIIEDATEK